MPSTYTANIGVEKPATGEQDGTWGDTDNLNYDIIDQAVAGIVQITLAATGTSGAPNLLPITDGALSNGRNKFIEFVDGGDLGGAAYVQLTPNDVKKVVHFRNSLSGSRSVFVFQGAYNTSNDFEIPNGKDVLLKFDGAGSGAVVSDVFADLLASAITTTNLTTSGTTNLDGPTVVNDSGASADFRVEGSGNQFALVVQGSNGNVGVGDATPDVALSVTRGTNSAIQISAGNLSDGDENVVTASTSINTATDFRYGQIGSYKSASNTHTAGFLRLDSQVGVINYLWVDDNAQLRISPTKAHIGTNNGTVVISDGGTAANLVVSDHLSIGNTETPTSITATGLDDLIVGDLGSDGGVVVLSSDVGAGAYSFLDAASGNPAGRILYQHDIDEMSINVGGFSRVRMTGTGQFAVCRSADAPQADDKFYVGTTSDGQSATVSGRNAGTNAYVRIDTSAARRNAIVWETNGSAAFSMERGDSDDADSSSLYLHPGAPDGGVSTAMVMASDGSVTFSQPATIPGVPSTSVEIVAGNGLTGGGTIAASRTIDVGAGNGISVTADAVAMSGTYTGTFTATEVQATSDGRLKSNVRSISNAGELLAGIDGKHYEFLPMGGAKQYGVLAQQVREVMPEAVGESLDGTLSVNYNQLVAVLIEAVKGLQKRVVDLEGS